MATLRENMEAIKLEKDTKILPENLKSGVTAFGVTGTLEGGATTGVKLFETVDEMNNSTGNEEGDLALIYRSEIQNLTETSVINGLSFKDTIILDTAITSSGYAYLMDENQNYETQYQLRYSSTYFYIRGYYSGDYIVRYTSTDGTTYTLDSGYETSYTFEQPMYFSGTWDDIYGQFIQCGGMMLEGLYQYSSEDETTHLQFYDIGKINNASGNYEVPLSGETLKLSEIQELVNEHLTDDTGFITYVEDTDNYFIVLSKNYLDLYSFYYNTSDNRLYWTVSSEYSSYESNFASLGAKIINISKADQTASYINISDCTDIIYTMGTSRNYSKIAEMSMVGSVACVQITVESGVLTSISNFGMVSYGSTLGVDREGYISTGSFDNVYEQIYSYKLAPTQLTATTDNVYEKEFYGVNGVETGTLQNKENLTKDEVKHRIDIWAGYSSGIVCPNDSSYMFQNCTNLTTIPLLNTSNVTNMSYMFNSCTNLTTIPELDTSSVTNTSGMFQGCTNLTTIPLLDTSSTTNTSSMFQNCTNLTTIPELDTSNVTTMRRMFQNCTNLTSIPSLNTSNVTNMRDMFNSCKTLTTIPLLNTSNVTNMSYMFNSCTNLTTIPELDTSSVTDMTYMFNRCTNLTSIPELDTSSVTVMSYMFSGCTNLSDDSLNNILAMCTNATSYTGTKTLKYISITEEQATTCTTLSNYQAFLDAGWTTGY